MMVTEKNWPASKVTLTPIDKIIPYDRNPRTHPQAQVDLIAASMMEDGVTAPILVDEDGVIIYGHGRRLAAIKNGFAKYPVITARGWSDERKRAVRIKDNSTAALSGWDTQLVRTEIGDLKVAGYDVALLGFPETQLRGWGISLGTESAQDSEIVPELPKKSMVRVGDLWCLGDHRILCGNCTKSKDVETSLGGASADLVFTDPPYNVAYSGLGQNRLGTIKNDDLTDAAFEKFLGECFEQMAIAMKPLSAIYICHPDAASAPKIAFENAFARHFQKSATIIWVKNAAGMGWQDYRSQHEPILYGWKAGKGKHRFYADRTKTTVWTISRDAQASYEHPTQKPVGLSTEAIVNSSKRGGIVFDPFVGAGGVVIACEMTGRKCVAIDLDPRYVEVCILRWEKFSGRRATFMDRSGHTFAEVSAQRKSGRPGVRKSSRAPRGGRSDLAGTSSALSARKGWKDAAGHPGEPISRRNARGGGAKQAVRRKGDARLAPEGRKPARQPPAVAGDS